MICEFDDFELNSDTRMLVRGGEPIKLQPKVMDLLILLAQNHTRFVSKRELYERLWCGVHVSNASLVRLVRELRRALGDDGVSPRVIRTLHSRGYQLIAPVRHADPARSTSRPERSAPEMRRTGSL
jgi:DNA-binding winged helix-turn-helix (wHTH) protein